jgi:hypothetical protein
VLLCDVPGLVLVEGDVEAPVEGLEAVPGWVVLEEVVEVVLTGRLMFFSLAYSRRSSITSLWSSMRSSAYSFTSSDLARVTASRDNSISC